MTPRKKTNKELHRVTCRCQTSKCYLGRFVDAYGVPQTGVEVLPDTLAAHTLADNRNRALSQLSSHRIDGQRNHNIDSLIGPVAQLSLNPSLLRESSSATSSAQHSTHGLNQSPSEEEDTTNPSATRPDDQRHDQTIPPKVCVRARLAAEAGVKMYNCDSYYTRPLATSNPLLLYVVLLVALMSIYGNLSITTASWLLDGLRTTITLCLTHGINVLDLPRPLLVSDATNLRRIPKTITTVISWLKIDPHLIEMNCCLTCFALYRIDRTPIRCTHQLANIPGGPPDGDDPNTEINPSVPSGDHKELDFSDKICGQPLLKFSRGKEIPVRRFAFQSLSEWIARLLSRPHTESWLDESLEESCKPFHPNQKMSDVHQSKVWKEFLGPDGRQFTSTSGNLTFAMFVDAINPYGNKTSGKHASITFVVMVCLTLPLRVRYRPENVFLVGIAPGPREPSLEQMNWILQPIVTELQTLWNPGLLLSQTHQYKNGRLIRVALLLFIADIPAIRRSLGFPSATANFFCSLCLLPKSKIHILDPKDWTPRTCTQHRTWAEQARDAKTVAERKKIFKTHGVRYSVLIELDYWNIIEYHVIDPMHNLLLGLIMWHVRRFWAMKDVKNEEEVLPPISKVELLNLYQEHSQPLSRDPNEKSDDVDSEGEHKDGENLLGSSLDNDTSTSDEDYNPFDDFGWNGKWEAPPLDEVVFDSTMLKIINERLPQIHIPSWVKRPIRVLGKASFGKLKADEWRNLLTLQLPLILIPTWFGQDPVKTSLLKNFLHLVSLVNLALKREISSTEIERYRHHINQYLEGALQIFLHCHLAPNHHMAIHLADCLERFGPVRAWWSFFFERMMGRILKGCHNNHIGELEITFTRSYCRAGNLSALLNDGNLPESLAPYITGLQSLYEPKEPTPKRLSNSNMKAIDESILKLLVENLNQLPNEECQWIAPAEHCLLSDDDALLFSPIQTQATFHRRVLHHGVSYSTFTASQNDSIVSFESSTHKEPYFGRIFAIFTHRRFSPQTGNIFDTWLHIQRFPQIPTALAESNSFARVQFPDVQSHLCAWGPTQNHVIRLDQIIAHCTWMMYRPSEIPNLKIPTIALILMKR